MFDLVNGLSYHKIVMDAFYKRNVYKYLQRTRPSFVLLFEPEL